MNEYKLDYDLPAKQKDLATTMDYQNTNMALQQPNMEAMQSSNTNNLNTSLNPSLYTITTGGQRLEG